MGNASAVNDAAAVVALASAGYADSHGMAARWAALSPMATPGSSRGSCRSARCRPFRKVLDRSGLKVDEIDVFEVNEELAELDVVIER